MILYSTNKSNSEACPRARERRCHPFCSPRALCRPFKNSAEGKTQPRLVFCFVSFFKILRSGTEMAAVQVCKQVAMGKADVVDALKNPSYREQLSCTAVPFCVFLSGDI